MEKIGQVVEQLFAKEGKKGCQALRILEAKSKESDEVYPYFDRFVTLMHDPNSYRRTRGLVLIAANAKWDTEHKVEEILDHYLVHIMDEKPITARQCIKAIPRIAKAKPDVKEKIVTALHKADVQKYGDSMRHLVYQDIVTAVREIEASEN